MKMSFCSGIQSFQNVSFAMATVSVAATANSADSKSWKEWNLFVSIRTEFYFHEFWSVSNYREYKLRLRFVSMLNTLNPSVHCSSPFNCFSMWWTRFNFETVCKNLSPSHKIAHEKPNEISGGWIPTVHRCTKHSSRAVTPTDIVDWKGTLSSSYRLTCGWANEIVSVECVSGVSNCFVIFQFSCWVCRIQATSCLYLYLLCIISLVISQNC